MFLLNSQVMSLPLIPSPHFDHQESMWVNLHKCLHEIITTTNLIGKESNVAMNWKPIICKMLIMIVKYFKVFIT